MTNDLVLLDDPHFIVDMMYARTNNMLGRAVYDEIGYGNKAYMHKDTLQALLRVVPFLEKNNCKMRVCDAYRPPKAHRQMLQLIPTPGFFAKTPELSNHCHGTAIDVCLTDSVGHNLSYPTEIDAYEKRFQGQVCQGHFDAFKQHLQKARHDYREVAPDALCHRQQLKELMENAGFEAIPHEWWHYNLKGWQTYPMIEW